MVLGGGGAAGNAWLIGVIAGLLEAGLDATLADLVIGTSAGATAAAQITGGTRPAELYAAILAAQAPRRTDPARPGGGQGPVRPAGSHMETTGAIIAAARDAAGMRRGMGAWAIGNAAASDASVPARWRATVASRLSGLDWPQRRLLITAVDAQTGEPAVFDRHSGVDLVDAVAASCSSSTAHGIGARQYIDGGYRRNENADLAAGCARVLVLSPFGGRTRHPLGWGMQLAAQVGELRAGGSSVETVFPDGNSTQLFGANALDPALRPPAARAGYRQGSALAGQLGAFWH
nr:patatin-like phospholipase family protein [Arthrobacter sp. SDTb3-6]